MTEPETHARALLIPTDSRDSIAEVLIDLSDGGYAQLRAMLSDEPEELELAQSPGCVAFFSPRAADEGRNNRATQLLSYALTAGDWLAGPVVLCGQQADTGLCSLPAELTLARVLEVT